jgi:hypothetical protein
MLTKLKQTAQSVVVLFLMTMLFSCGGLLKSSIKDDGKQIPPNFGKEDFTMLVLRKGQRSYDKYLEKNFKGNYFGSYVIIDAEELSRKQYDDKKKYRYVFSENKRNYYSTQGSNQGATAIFAVTDRLTNETYKTKFGTGAFASWMKAYIQALEKTRQKNKLP